MKRHVFLGLFFALIGVLGPVEAEEKLISPLSILQMTPEMLVEDLQGGGKFLSLELLEAPNEDVALTNYRGIVGRAQKGNPRSQYNLGVIYEEGLDLPTHGVAIKRSVNEAIEWFRKSAEQGLPEAQTKLARVYLRGDDVPQNFEEAKRWYLAAAQQGVLEGYLEIAEIYAVGKGVPQHFNEAARWYREAAERGVPAAQYRLALMYEKGHGVPQDNVLAHMWLNIASARDHGDARKRRDKLVESMSTAELAKAQDLARDWVAKKP